MEHAEVKELGWKQRSSSTDGTYVHNQYTFDEYLMAVLFDYEEGFDFVFIKDTDNVTVNVWENSDTVFFGMIKTDSDLKDVMRFTGIIEY
jgi:hypothetical protein